MNEQDILYQSLLGKNLITDTRQFDLVQNELAKQAPGELRDFFTGNKIETNETKIKNHDAEPREDLWQGPNKVSQEEQFFPLVLSIGQNSFTLPYEPMISISGKNRIAKRHVAKMKPNRGKEIGGTIKERWTQGDYEITITGALYGNMLRGDYSQCFPKDDFEQLRDLLIQAERIEVKCEPLQLLGINYIVVEEFNFPFTKGENVQAYEIMAISDFDYNLFLKIDD